MTKLSHHLLIFFSLLYLIGAYFLSKSLPLGKEPYLQSTLVVGIFLLSLFIISSLKTFSGFFQKTYYVLMTATLGIVFLFSPPSDDVNRYLWEGIMVKEGLNPYNSSPVDSKKKLLSIDEKTSNLKANIKKKSQLKFENRKKIYDGINNKNKTAIYGPLFLLFMTLLMYISESFFIYKLVTFLFSMSLLFLAFRLLKEKRLALKMAGYFFLNPLFLIFALGETHNEIILLLPLALCLFYLNKVGKGSLVLLFLGIAINIKLTVFLLAPIIVKRSYLRHWYFFFIPFLGYLIFTLSGQSPFDSLFSFSTDFYFNNYVFKLLEDFFGGVIRYFLLIFLLIFIFLFNIYSLDPKRVAFFTLYIFFLLSPTVHPWYLLPLLFINILFVSPSVLVFSLSFLFLIPHYYLYLNSGQWYQPLWSEISVAVLIWFSFALDFLIYSFKTVHSKYPILDDQRGVSVIVPTLNEENNLGRNLQSLFPLDSRDEIIIADAGSKDNTVQVAKEMNLRVIQCAPGRGVQIKTAVDIAKNDFILVMHADTIAYQDILDRVRLKLSELNITIGAFSMSYNNNWMTFIQLLNNFRAKYLGISFGDQMQFFRRSIVNQFGDFPAFPLMEDVEISLRMKAVGKICLLPSGGEISDRRWNKAGYFKNMFKVISLFHEYLFIHSWSKHVPVIDFYNRYYQSSFPQKT